MPSSESAIDQLDRQLVTLIERRSELVGAQVAAGIDAWGTQIDRVGEIVRGEIVRGGASPSGLEPESLHAILRHVASACCQRHRPIEVAFLGPIDSYSHLAALTYFGNGVGAVPVASIAAVFDSVERGECERGMVPIENSTDGRVVDTLSRLLDGHASLVGEVLVPIHHNLLASVSRDQITEVHSKPQALSQCRGWLASHLPSARLVETTSTAAAAQLAANTPGIAAVASLQAAHRFGLRVIQANIEDNRHNVTRFAVLGRSAPPPSGADKTTLMFQVAHQPGALADVMGIFKNEQLNLTWIESFPEVGTQNEYFFVVEFPGHQDDSSVARAIGSLRKQARSCRVLGSYPTGQRPAK